MDDCSRQDPAYRPATEKPRSSGASPCLRGFLGAACGRQVLAPTPAGTAGGWPVRLASSSSKYSWPSMLKLGTILSSHLGMYQFHLPIRIMRDGTSRQLTTVASRM